jgi:glycosyltransferase involved in cell wall biosynthesis
MQTTKIKALIIGSHPPPIGGPQFGGQAILIETIMLSGVDYGIDYTLFYIGHDKPNIIKRIFVSICFVIRLFVLLIRKNKDIDLVHIHTATGLALFEKSLLGLICRIFGKPVILHIHGGKLKYMFDHTNRISLFFIKRLLMVPSLIIVLSNKMRDIIKNELPRNLSVQVLENATKISAKNLTVNKSNHCNDSITLLFVGHLKREKGILDLLEAYKKLQKKITNRVSLNIVGGADTSDIGNEIKAIYRASGVQGVQFKGVLTGKDLVSAYEQADIFVLPSHSEDQPLTLIEAMTFGLPIISTKVGSIPDLVLDEVNGLLVNPHDVDGLFNSLMLLTTSKEMRAEMGKKNCVLATKRFGFDSYMTRLRNLYEQILI